MYFLRKRKCTRDSGMCSVPGQSPGPAHIGRCHPPALHGSYHDSVLLYAVDMIPQLNTRTPKTRGGNQSLQQGEGSEKGEGK
uniref:Uncharacterized protein n=1 Tax=Ailuropoda melanoleuca TaxID=9646 RepID=A0A7N5P2C1_AILME